MVHSASESYSSRYTADNNKILYNGVCSSGKFFTWQINLKFQTSTTIFWCAVVLIFGGSKIDLHMVVSLLFISMPTCNINHPLILLLCVSQSVSSVAQSCPAFCDPMNHSTPGLPVHHQVPEFTQTHVQRVGDGIQPSHPLSSPSPPAPNPSQHQGLFQRVNSPNEVAKVLEFQLQHQAFQWIPRTDLP